MAPSFLFGSANISLWMAPLLQGRSISSSCLSRLYRARLDLFLFLTCARLSSGAMRLLLRRSRLCPVRQPLTLSRMSIGQQMLRALRRLRLRQGPRRFRSVLLLQLVLRPFRLASLSVPLRLLHGVARSRRHSWIFCSRR